MVGMGSGVGLTLFQAWLSHFLAVQLWHDGMTSVNLNFLPCKMGIIIVHNSYVVRKHFPRAYSHQSKLIFIAIICIINSMSEKGEAPLIYLF